MEWGRRRRVYPSLEVARRALGKNTVTWLSPDANARLQGFITPLVGGVEPGMTFKEVRGGFKGSQEDLNRLPFYPTLNGLHPRRQHLARLAFVYNQQALAKHHSHPDSHL